jgi:hypothetical protein
MIIYQQPTNFVDSGCLVKPDVSFFMYSAFGLILKKIGKHPAVNLKKRSLNGLKVSEVLSLIITTINP